MYINTGKVLRRFSRALAILALLLGIGIFALSKTAVDQSSGTLMALFGLMLLWFTIWLQRTAPITPNTPVTNTRNSANATTSSKTSTHSQEHQQYQEPQQPARANDNLRRRA